MFVTVADWVAGYLLPRYRRSRQQRWCPVWWEHAEAVDRLDALWQSWEALRSEGPTGLAVWWRDFADHHLHVLTDPELGPFHACDTDRGGHRVPPQFRSDPPPPDLFGKAR